MPEAFDAFLFTPPDDRSQQRISQRAVTNLSSIGGGSGGGVAAALQGGFLRFFDDFGYDRLGLSCRLANDVCLMGGVMPAPGGYYIVKGSGPAAHRRDRQPDARGLDHAGAPARRDDGVRNRRRVGAIRCARIGSATVQPGSP